MRVGERVDGRYEILKRAGSGGMGAVFRARDLETGTDVAVKTLWEGVREQYASRFVREAQLLAMLEHPGIVRYLAHGFTDEDEMFLVMEWLEGCDLAARIERATLPVEAMLELGVWIADALAAAHAHGIVHRDIKPSNVFLIGGSLENIKVLDFGIARRASSGDQLTEGGLILGTPGFIAPEQARGSRRVDARADVFSLGCMLFASLTGRPPFHGADAVAILAKIVLEEAPRIRTRRIDVPQSVDALLARFMARQPSDRPADGAAAARELRAVISNLNDETEEVTVIGAPQITAGERWLVSVVMAARACPPRASVPPSAIQVDAGTSDDSETVTAEETGDDGADAADAERDALALASIAERYEARTDRLADGTVITTLHGAGAASDLAVRAARCALDIRTLLPHAPIAIATGRAQLTERAPLGEAIDRAAHMVRVVSAGSEGLHGVVLDELTAGLLGTTFEVHLEHGNTYLQAERDPSEPARTLLGRPSPLVGRDRDLAELRETYDDCTSESVACAVRVSGPAGVGKSRLRYELLHQIRTRDPGAEIWQARADPLTAGSGFAIVARLIRRTAGLIDGEAMTVRQRKLRARLARVMSGSELERVTQFIGQLAGVQFPEQTSPALRAARRNATLMSDQMRAAWIDWIRAESSLRPLLIVVDDLHWADALSINLLLATTFELTDKPVMLLAFARPDSDPKHGLDWRERGGREIQLAGLSPRAAMQLVREILGETIANQSLQELVRRAGGNAFFLEELIRGQAEGKSRVVPATVVATVQSRLQTLDSPARRVLRAASVFGERFSRDGVAALTGSSVRTEMVFRLLEQLVEDEWLVPGVRMHTGDLEYSFRHAFIRDASYEMLTESDRALGHALAARWLAKSGDHDSLVLAEHFDRGGEREAAAEWYLAAAETSLACNDDNAALSRADRGVACGARGEILGRLRAVESEAYRSLGDLTRAEARGLQAMDRV